jgi:hypothetical protein
MATVLYGPFVWIQPRGQYAFMPGQEHHWSAGDFPGSPLVFDASAHPTRERAQQALMVTDLYVEYGRTGGPVIRFVVRNVGQEAVFLYRVFITATAF